MKRKVGALEKVEADLPNLQEKIRRDPLSYKGDFLAQFAQYESYRQLLLQAPASAPDDNVVSLRDLIDFVAHVAYCYPDVTKDFAPDLISLLRQHHHELEPELRDKIARSLILLRNKEQIDSSTFLDAIFPILISTPSKALRSLLYSSILTDLKTANARSTHHKLNRTLQTTLFTLLTTDRASPKAIWAVRITRELWRKQIWTDVKAVSIMKEAALAENAKVLIGGVLFFLGGDREREEAADQASDDEEAIDMAKLRHAAGINKKTRSKAKELKQAAATLKKRERKKNKPAPLNFSALHLLHDPQGFAEQLFSRHLQASKSKLNLDHKLLVLQLVSRLVGLHKLTILPLYSYFLKFLTPRQASVTSFLASLAQSVHNLVPPDALEPLVQKIAHEFVSEASAGPVAAAGLNAIREMCARQPLAMPETLLQDLVLYRKSKDKGVMMAAKGLLSLYRDVGAEKLRKRDRGREAALGLRSGDKVERRFGEEGGALGIEGLELLEKWKQDEQRRKRVEAGLPAELAEGEEAPEEADDEDWNAWDVQSDASSDSGGWIDVQSDGEDINISDSEDEKEPKAKRARTASPDGAKSATPATEASTAAAEAARISNLATTRILTPADLAKLAELRQQAAVTALMPSARRRAAAEAAQRHLDDGVTAEDLEQAAKLGAKATKEEKLAAARADREDADHRSSAARRQEKKRAEGKSTTNREKARKKNFMMTLGKAKGKQKRSLVEARKVLRGHVERAKRGGRRGNR